MQTMKIIAAALTSLSLLASAPGRSARTPTDADSAARPAAAVQATPRVAVTRHGARPSQRGPAEWFTGTVRIDPLFDPNDASRAGSAYVTFEPGARTAWHTHPRGQRLVVTAGVGACRAGADRWTRSGRATWCGSRRA